MQCKSNSSNRAAVTDFKGSIPYLMFSDDSGATVSLLSSPLLQCPSKLIHSPLFQHSSSCILQILSCQLLPFLLPCPPPISLFQCNAPVFVIISRYHLLRGALPCYLPGTVWHCCAHKVQQRERDGLRVRGKKAKQSANI